MQLRLFTLAYGAKYTTWLRDVCLPSLSWPRNLAALKAHADAWDIYCEDADRAVLTDMCRPFGIPLHFHFFNRESCTHITQHNCLTHHVGLCADSNRAMFVAPPDTVFGEGTLETLFKVGEQSGTCVAFVHVRVNGRLPATWKEPVPNGKLVDIAFKNLHPTWEFANAERKTINSKTSGVLWRKISDKLWLVQHRLPTCYLANVARDDVDWLNTHRPGLWDHGWPEKLVNEQRHRYFGSSDAGFAIELTDMSDNLPEVEPKDTEEPDAYQAEFGHHAINRGVMVTLRGE